MTTDTFPQLLNFALTLTQYTLLNTNYNHFPQTVLMAEKTRLWYSMAEHLSLWCCRWVITNWLEKNSPILNKDIKIPLTAGCTHILCNTAYDQVEDHWPPSTPPNPLNPLKGIVCWNISLYCTRSHIKNDYHLQWYWRFKRQYSREREREHIILWH